jgi:hypothetical protein
MNKKYDLKLLIVFLFIVVIIAIAWVNYRTTIIVADTNQATSQPSAQGQTVKTGGEESGGQAYLALYVTDDPPQGANNVQ